MANENLLSGIIQGLANVQMQKFQQQQEIARRNQELQQKLNEDELLYQRQQSRRPAETKRKIEEDELFRKAQARVDMGLSQELIDNVVRRDLGTLDADGRWSGGRLSEMANTNPGMEQRILGSIYGYNLDDNRLNISPEVKAALAKGVNPESIAQAMSQAKTRDDWAFTLNQIKIREEVKPRYQQAQRGQWVGAFDPQTGKHLNWSELPGGEGTHTGRNTGITRQTKDGRIVQIDPKTGKILWEHDFKGAPGGDSEARKNAEREYSLRMKRLRDLQEMGDPDDSPSFQKAKRDANLSYKKLMGIMSGDGPPQSSAPAPAPTQTQPRNLFLSVMDAVAGFGDTSVSETPAGKRAVEEPRKGNPYSDMLAKLRAKKRGPSTTTKDDYRPQNVDPLAIDYGPGVNVGGGESKSLARHYLDFGKAGVKGGVNAVRELTGTDETTLEYLEEQRRKKGDFAP